MNRNERELEEVLHEYAAGRLNRRSFLVRAGLLGVGAMAAGSLLSACSDDSTDTGASGGDATGDPVKGGNFREGYDRDFTPPDPVFNAWADPTFMAFFEAVVTRDPDGNIVPLIASAFNSGDDGWVFDIPDNLTFQSGAPLTPQAVAEFFDIARDPNQGANAIFWAPITDVKSDKTSVTCTTDHPFLAFQETVATEYSFIINTKAREKAGDDWGSRVLDGSGPFTLGEFVPGRHVVGNRWDDYPGCNAPFITNKGPAYLDSIEWISITEASQRASEIETGNVDAVKNPPPQDIDRLKSNSDLVVQEFQELSNFYLSLNLANSEFGFDDVKVRQAISHAIDRQALVESIFLGHAVATYGPVMPGNRWYDSGVESYNQFDPDESAKLFDEAGWKLGGDGVRAKNGKRLSFPVLHLTETTEDQVLEAMTQMLADVGVEITLDGKASAAFWSTLSDTTPAYAFKWLWSSPIDVIQYFADVYQPDNSLDPDIQSLYGAWQSAGDDTELGDAANKYQMFFAENLPIVPIYTPNTIWVNTKKVIGWSPNQANIYPFYNDVWLAS